MEFVEDRHEVGEHENDQNRADPDCQDQDHGGVDHRAAQLLECGVLALQVGGDLDQHLVERSAVLGRAHHVDVQLVENARVTGDGGRKGLAGLEVVEDVIERCPERPRARRPLEQLDRVRDRHADPDEGGELAREEDQEIQRHPLLEGRTETTRNPRSIRSRCTAAADSPVVTRSSSFPRGEYAR